MSEDMPDIISERMSNDRMPEEMPERMPKECFNTCHKIVRLKYHGGNDHSE